MDKLNEIVHAHPRDGTCEDSCTGDVCFSSTAGIASVSGTAAPGFALYEQASFAEH